MEAWKIALEILTAFCLLVVYCWLIWNVDKNKKQIQKLKEEIRDLKSEQIDHWFSIEDLKAKVDDQGLKNAPSSNLLNEVKRNEKG